MKTLRTIHLYLGCAFAPLLVFFVLSGFLQTFELHEGKKGGSYQPPAWVVHAGSVHTHQRLAGEKGAPREPNWPMQIVSATTCVGLFATVTLGVAMAWQMKRERRRAMLRLAAGVVLPVVILIVQRGMK